MWRLTCAAVDAPFALLFHFGHHWRRATEHHVDNFRTIPQKSELRGDMNGTPSVKQPGMLHSKIAQAALISLVIIAFSAALWRTSHSRVSDPVFDGKPLSAWLHSYFDYVGMWPREPP